MELVIRFLSRASPRSRECCRRNSLSGELKSFLKTKRSPTLSPLFSRMTVTHNVLRTRRLTGETVTRDFFFNSNKNRKLMKDRRCKREDEKKVRGPFGCFLSKSALFSLPSRSLPSFLFLLFDFCDSSYVLSLSSSLASLPHTQTHFPVIYH